MTQFTLARRNILVCALILAVISGSIVLSGWRRAQMLEQFRNYADTVGFNEFLQNAQANLGSTPASMKERVASYLGNSELIDQLDSRPLVADSDPDLAEKYPLNEEEDDDIAEFDEFEDKNEENANANAKVKEEVGERVGDGKASRGAYKSGSPRKSNKTRATKSIKGAATRTLAAELNKASASKYSPAHKISSNDTPQKFKAALPENPYPGVPGPTRENTSGHMQFRIYSHNVKSAARRPSAPGEHPWHVRKRHVISSIKQNAGPNTLVFLQDPQRPQIDDIMQELNIFPAGTETEAEWAYLGGGRLNGGNAGEHVPIIYRPAEWTVLYNDTIWLNNGRPRLPDYGWDATYPRILTYATLQHRASAQILNVANTQFDYDGSVARRESAALVAEKMAALNQWPSFIAGDLSAPPDEESVQHLSSQFCDVHDLVPDYSRYGHPDYSETGFSGKYLAEARRVDYIFAPRYTRKLSERACTAQSQGRYFSVRVVGYGLLHSKYGGVYMSDHRPVMADFVVAGCAQ